MADNTSQKDKSATKIYVLALMPVLIVTAVLLVLWFQLNTKTQRDQWTSPGTKKLDEITREGIPHVELVRLSGASFSLNQFKDKIVLLNFWASWCDPCVKEFPSMMKLVDHFKGELVLVAVSSDSNKQDIETFLKAFKVKEGPNIVIAWDKDQRVSSSFGTTQLPESYLFSRGLVLRRKVIGLEDWYSPNVISFFDELVKQD